MVFKNFFHFNSLRTRLTLLVLTISVSVLLLAGFVIVNHALSIIRQNNRQQLAAANRVLATAVSVWLENHRHALHNLVLTNDIISMNAERQKPVLKKMEKSHPSMYLISTVGLNGVNVARNDGLPPKNYRDRDWFVNTRKGVAVMYQSLIGRTIGKPALVMSMPIKNEGGVIVGVGMFALNMEKLAEEIRLTKIGETGFAYLVDDAGRVVVHPRHVVDESLADLTRNPAVDAFLKGTRGHFQFVDKDGVRWLANVSVLENGWGVLVQQQAAELQKTRFVFLTIVLLIVFFSATVLMLATWWGVKQSLVPVEKLTSLVKDFQRDTDDRSNIESLRELSSSLKPGNEISLLSESFYRMALRVRETLKNLETELLERIQAEMMLRESEGKYRTLVNNLRVGVYRSEPAIDGKFMQINPVMVEMFGYGSVEELLGVPIKDMYQEPWSRNAYLKEITGKGYVKDFQLAMKQKNGVPIWCSITTTAQYDSDKNLLWMDGIIEDITEKKEIQEALVRSRNYLDNIINTVADPLFVKDRSHRWVVLNNAYCGFLGCNRDELLGKSDHDFFPEEEADLFMKTDESVFTTGKENITEEILTDRGGTSHIAITKRALYTDENGERYIVGIIRDITELKKLEDDIRQLQKMETVGMLAGSVAHDFNNLLTPIIGYCDLLTAGGARGNDSQGFIEQIRSAAECARDLTGRLLAFSRKQIIDLKTVDLGDVAQRFEKMMGRTIRENIRMEVKVPEERALVRADAGQIEQILVNLSVNAQDAMPEGGDLVIEVVNADIDEYYTSTHFNLDPGKYVALMVSDTGTGMDDETRRHMFEPFFTTKEIERGTGLGLSTVYGIVKQHGGSIFVYSEKGLGTTFKIYLPRLDDEYAEISEEPQVPHELPRGNETILLVEDSDMVRRLVNSMLEMLGYRVITAAHPEDGIKKAAEHRERIDLLLTDVVMPGMNGRELYNRLESGMPGLKVIYMSAYTNDVIVHHGIVDENIHFISKPFTLAVMADRIRGALDT